MTLKVLVVDDEAPIRHGIIRKIQRLAGFCQVVGEAKNGEEAFNIIQKTHVDVVISDIKMPGMGGLLLIEKARDLNPDLKFIIISGYDNFEFAQQAIRLGVYDYLLKPVDNKLLLLNLERIYKIIQTEQENTEFLKLPGCEHTKRTELALLEQTFDGEKNWQDLTEILHAEGVMLDKPNFTVACLVLHTETITLNSSHLNQALILKLLRNASCENATLIPFRRNEDDNHIWCLINHIHGGSWLEAFMNMQVSTISQRTGFSAHCALGSIQHSLAALSLSAKDATLAGQQRILFPQKTVITYGDYMQVRNNTKQLSPDEQQILRGYMKNISTQKEQLKKHVRQMVMDLVRKNICYESIQNICIQAATLMLNESTNLHQSDSPLFDQSPDSFFSHTETADTICANFDKLISSIALEDGTDSGKKIVREIEKQIRREYFHDLKLSTFAERYYINPSYLSTLFIKITGENFSKYLTNVRLEQAISLLETTQFPAAQIAEFVGYNDRSYFSSVFRKKYGMTPLEYRRSLNRGEKPESEGI